MVRHSARSSPDSAIRRTQMFPHHQPITRRHTESSVVRHHDNSGPSARPEAVTISHDESDDSEDGEEGRGRASERDYDKDGRYQPTESTVAESFAGAEPGINPRQKWVSERFGVHFRQECVIEVVDYCSEDAIFMQFGNKDFLDFMDEDDPTSAVDEDASSGSEENGRGKRRNASTTPKWVRWINVSGIDWKVISALALKYELHDLALEDVLREQRHNQSKADYYRAHLFIRILCHILLPPGATVPSQQNHPRANHLPTILETLHPTMEPPSSDHNRSQSPNSPSFMQKLKSIFRRKRSDSRQADSSLPSERPSLQTSSSKAMDDLERGQPPSPDGINGVQNADEKIGLQRCQPLEPAEILDAPGLPMDDHDGNTQNLRRLRKPRSTEVIKRRFTGLAVSPRQVCPGNLLPINALMKGDRVNVRHEPMSIFLLRNGSTVISIHPTARLSMTAPIKSRLHRPESVLRMSEDASLLVESLLDLVVDRVLEVTDEYQARINKLEHEVLLRPQMHYVRRLHILSGDLIMHKRTLQPMKAMLFGLRMYDYDRCVALAEGEVGGAPFSTVQHGGSTGRARADTAHTAGTIVGWDDWGEGRAGLEAGGAGVDAEDEQRVAEPEDEEQRGTDDAKFGERTHVRNKPRKRRRRRTNSKQVQGYLSYKTKVYLADVCDHIDYILTSLDMFAGISENLINYAFNMASYELNMVMRRLTLATILFLPLTLLTGYFGMNILSSHHSESYFWVIAVPLMAGIIPLFMWSDIAQLVSYLRRRMDMRRSVRGL